MGVNIDIVPFDIPTTPGVINIDGYAGFGNPKAVFFFIAATPARGTAKATVNMSYGAADGTREWAMGGREGDALGTTSTMRSFVNDNCIGVTGGSDVFIEGNFDSWRTDGVAVNITDVPSSLRKGQALMFGGADVSAYAGTINLGTGTGAITTTIGFEADLIIVCNGGKAIAADTISAPVFNAIGFVYNDGAGTITQHHHMYVSASGVSQTSAYARVDTSYGTSQYSSSTGSVIYNVTFGNFTATGFDVTPSANAGGDDIGFLALKFTGKDVKVGVYDTPTTEPSNDENGPSLGFQPDLVGMIPSMLDAINVTEGNNSAETEVNSAFCCWTDTDAYCTHGTSDAGATTTDANCYTGDQPVDIGLSSGSGWSQEFAATYDSMQSDTWRLDWSATNATARKWIYFAIGEAAGGTTVTITTDLNALIQKTISASINFDALLQTNIPITLSLDGIIKTINEASTFLDANIQKLGVTKTISFDSLILKKDSKTVSIDALLQTIGIESSLSVDALIKKEGLTSQLSLDAILIGTESKLISTSLDALIKKYGIVFQISLDALLAKANTMQVSLDSLIKKKQIDTVLIDTLLMKSMLQNLQFDAMLYSKKTNNVLLDANINKLQSIVTSLDAIIAGLGIETKLDALISKLNQINTISLDALLLEGKVLNTTLDSIIYEKLGLNINIDGIINKKGREATTLLDAIIYSALISAYAKHIFSVQYSRPSFTVDHRRSFQAGSRVSFRY